MQVTAMVTGVEVERYKTKQGADRETVLLSCLDRSENHPLKNTFDFSPQGMDEAACRALRNKDITIQVSDIQARFGGRFKFIGEMVKSK